MTRYRHNRRVAAWLLVWALLLMSGSFQVSWQCLNGTLCPGGLPMHVLSAAAAHSSLVAPSAACPHCEKRTAPSAHRSSRLETASCVLRDSGLPIAARIEIAPTLFLPAAVIPRAPALPALTVGVPLFAPEPFAFSPAQFLRPHPGRAPPVLL